jgi:predicted DNA-binding ribbon-helix-helix protein
MVIHGRKTSVTLEDAFWEGLHKIACRDGLTVRQLIEGIAADRKHGNLSSAIRVFVLSQYRLPNIVDRVSQRSPKARPADSSI